MTLKQFMQENVVTAFEVVPEVLILNVEVDQTEYALDVDTSEIQFGTMLERVEDFTVDGDTLTVAGLTLNTSTTYVLGIPETPSE